MPCGLSVSGKLIAAYRLGLVPNETRLPSDIATIMGTAWARRFANQLGPLNTWLWEYIGWLSELSGHVSHTRKLPFVVAEYFKPGLKS